MIRKNPLDSMRAILVLLLCATFFILAMGLTLLGSNVYRRTAAQADIRYTQRTALSYLVNQLRRGDRAEGIRIGDFDGIDTIEIREVFEDDSTVYVTRLYCYEGQLCELFAEQSPDLQPQDGIAILPLAALSVEGNESEIQITVTDEHGEQYEAALSPRCGFEEVNVL